MIAPTTQQMLIPPAASFHIGHRDQRLRTHAQQRINLSATTHKRRFMLRIVGEAAMVIGKGFTDRFLSAGELRDIVTEAVESVAFAEKRILVIIPDGTRTMPMPLMFGMLQEVLGPQVKALDYLVAL